MIGMPRYLGEIVLISGIYCEILKKGEQMDRGINRVETWLSKQYIKMLIVESGLWIYKNSSRNSFNIGVDLKFSS